MIFEDRQEAGRLLGEYLLNYKNEKPIIFALPRGGLPVGYEVAKLLDAPLKTIVVRKLGMPFFPELGFGAVAPDGVLAIDQTLVDRWGLDHEQIQAVQLKELRELDIRIKKYGVEKPEDLGEKTAIIVDDGIATGITTKAAIIYIRKFNPSKIVVASPTCAAESERMLQKEVDKVICLNSSESFAAVGEWYKQFEQTSDEEVIDILNRAKK